MLTLKINNELDFGMEREAKKLRLVLLNKNTELACRKETFGNLQKFLAAEEAHAFKGRLQLYKHNNSISVALKGEKLGTIAASKLENYMAELKKY